MAGIEQCLRRALRAQVITQKQADRIRQLSAASDQDDKRFLETFIQETQENQRVARLQAIATKRNADLIKAHPDGVGRGIVGLLVRDVEGHAPYSNVDYRAKSILAEYYGRFAEAMERYRTKNLGFSQDTAGVKNMVKELFGEGANDADAKVFAKMWSDTAEAARLRFNVAGGNIPKRKDWGLPHTHNANQIAKLPLDKWREFIVPRLDRQRIYSQDGLPMGQKQFDDLITGLHQKFQEEAGVIHDIPRTVSREIDHRLLTFKNAQGWLEYNDRFGEPDLYHSMMHYLENMAHDTAMLEILGPSPDRAMQGFIDQASKAKTPAMTQKMIKDAYNVVSGRINQSDNDFLAGLGQGIRNWLSSAQLGSAFISSFTDVFTAKHTLAFNGVPGVKFVKEIFSQMRPGNAEDRIFAVKLGLGAEAWVTRALAASRFQEITGHGLSAKISDTVFRASLLSPWTDATRKAFGMELSGFVAEQAGKTFDDLPDLLKNSFGRYGITKQQWNVIRKAKLIDREGAKFLRPQDILEQSRGIAKEGADIFRNAAENIEAEEKLAGNRPGALGVRMAQSAKDIEGVQERIIQIRDAANKLHEMMLSEMDFAVVTPDARVRAITTQGLPKGSVMGELARSFSLYKSFPISMITSHLYRGASQIDGLSKAKYLAELMVGLTVIGGIGLQTREILKGKDPRNMADPKFWGAAFAQGGSLGLYGDFLFADANRYGKGIPETLAGPVFSLAKDTSELTMGNLWKFLEGQEKTHFMRDSVNYFHSYMPGRSTWWARLALDRMMFDSLREMADPHASTSFRRTMQNARKDFGQEFWWKPGQSAPERLPDLGEAINP